MNYQQAIAYLQGGRDKESRPFGNNTRLERRADGIAVRLHATDVVTLLPDGGVRLNSGGWRTVTTKARMNDHLRGLGWNLYAKRRQWFLSHVWGKPYSYTDKVTVWCDGRITSE